MQAARCPPATAAPCPAAAQRGQQVGDHGLAGDTEPAPCAMDQASEGPALSADTPVPDCAPHLFIPDVLHTPQGKAEEGAVSGVSVGCIMAHCETTALEVWCDYTTASPP